MAIQGGGGAPRSTPGRRGPGAGPQGIKKSPPPRSSPGRRPPAQGPAPVRSTSKGGVKANKLTPKSNRLTPKSATKKPQMSQGKAGKMPMPKTVAPGQPQWARTRSGISMAAQEGNWQAGYGRPKTRKATRAGGEPRATRSTIMAGGTINAPLARRSKARGGKKNG